MRLAIATLLVVVSLSACTTRRTFTPEAPPMPALERALEAREARLQAEFVDIAERHARP